LEKLVKHDNPPNFNTLKTEIDKYKDSILYVEDFNKDENDEGDSDDEN